MHDGRRLKAYTDPRTSMEALAAPDDFVEYIDQLYELATSYQANRAPHGPDPSRQVIDYLRHEEYGNYQWKRLVGGIDQGFIDWVRESRLTPLRAFRDPVFGFVYNVAHFSAAAVGYLEYGRPTGISTNRGDVAAWSGDWITFYGDWRREHEDFPSGFAFCRDKLASLDVDSTFMFSDLIEDADGYNIGMALHQGENISAAVHAVFAGGRRAPRARQFFQDRFGDEVTADAAAKDALLAGDDELVQLGRLYLVQAIGGLPTLLPHMLPPERIDQFCRGFTSVLLRCVADERNLLEADLFNAPA